MRRHVCQKRLYLVCIHLIHESEAYFIRECQPKGNYIGLIYCTECFHNPTPPLDQFVEVCEQCVLENPTLGEAECMPSN
jgi:hypothetical protein